MAKNVPRPQPLPDYHHGDLRRALVQAGAKLVEQDQSWAFSLREVTRALGVSHNAPYRHFADKNAFLAAIATLAFQDLRTALLKRSRPAKNAVDALIEIGIAYIEFGTVNPACYRLMFGGALAGAGEESAALAAAAQSAKDVLEQAVHEISSKSQSNEPTGSEITGAAWAIVHGVVGLLNEGMIKGSARDRSRFSERAVRLFASGLLARPF